MLTTTPIDAISLRIVAVHGEGSLDDVAGPWNALAGDVPFRRWEWAQTWWRHYQDAHSQLFTLLVFDDQQHLVGIAPWYVSRNRRQGRVVRFLGSGEVCSDYLTVLAEPEWAEVVAERIAQWLATEGASQWDLLDLSGVEASDATIAALERGLVAHGRLVDRQPDMSCWRAALPGAWEQFLATLSKSRRERTRALLRRAIDTGRAVVHQVRTESDLERGFAILIDLHQKRRRSLSQAGCFASERFTEFHREMAGRFLADGRLRMLWTELDGQPVAVEYSFVGGETVYYYQGGFEPELADERPGWLGFAVSLKLAIEQGYQSYDFLRGDESYKASWRAAARPLVHVRAVGTRRSARLRFAAWRAGEAVKARARQFLSSRKEGP
jgi:CelD/BcsL family acetyltransferase involved in cellulose biosynthesis